MAVAHEVTQRPRDRRREATLARILETAMATIISGGFGSLSMNKLADAVHFTPGALYRYFPSKDALLSALVDRILTELRARLAAVSVEDPLARIFALARAYRTFAAEEPHKFGLLAMSMAEPKIILGTSEAAEPVVRSMIGALSPLADALGAAATKDKIEPGDALERTLVVFGAIQGALQLQKQARIAPAIIDVDRLITQAVRTLLCGWGADARALDRAGGKVVARKRAGGAS
jgi:AcrR family transcriptional regulator